MFIFNRDNMLAVISFISVVLHWTWSFIDILRITEDHVDFRRCMSLEIATSEAWFIFVYDMRLSVFHKTDMTQFRGIWLAVCFYLFMYWILGDLTDVLLEIRSLVLYDIFYKCCLIMSSCWMSHALCLLILTAMAAESHVWDNHDCIVAVTWNDIGDNGLGIVNILPLFTSVHCLCTFTVWYTRLFLNLLMCLFLVVDTYFADWFYLFFVQLLWSCVLVILL